MGEFGKVGRHDDLPAGDRLKLAGEARVAESRRVAGILARDRSDARRERRRVEAIVEVEDGTAASFDDTKLGPTPERMAKGEFRTVAVGKVEGSARAVTTVRDMAASRIVKLYQRGVLDDDLFAACSWYRTKFERCGLDIAAPVARLGERVAGEKFYGAMARTEMQAIDRDLFRGARAAIRGGFEHLFDDVVLADMPLEDVEKAYRCGRRSAVARLRSAALDVHGFAVPHLPVRRLLEEIV